MDSKDSSKDELKNEELPEASPPKSIISKVGEWLKEAGRWVGGCFLVLYLLGEFAVALAISGVLMCLYLITLAIPIAIGILIALWAYKTFLAD